MNLKLLINQSYKGNTAAFAHEFGRASTQIYKLVSSKSKGHHVAIGPKMNKAIEEHFSLSNGWLDAPRTKEWLKHELITPTEAAKLETSLNPDDGMTMDEREFLHYFRKMNSDEQDCIMKTMEILGKTIK